MIRDLFTRAISVLCSRIVGVLALNHAIRLVGWPKHVIFLSLTAISGFGAFFEVSISASSVDSGSLKLCVCMLRWLTDCLR